MPITKVERKRPFSLTQPSVASASGRLISYLNFTEFAFLHRIYVYLSLHIRTCASTQCITVHCLVDCAIMLVTSPTTPTASWTRIEIFCFLIYPHSCMAASTLWSRHSLKRANPWVYSILSSSVPLFLGLLYPSSLVLCAFLPFAFLVRCTSLLCVSVGSS